MAFSSSIQHYLAVIYITFKILWSLVLVEYLQTMQTISGIVSNSKGHQKVFAIYSPNSKFIIGCFTWFAES